MLMDYYNIVNEQIVRESKLHHVCAQAKHYLSGLKNIKSSLGSSQCDIQDDITLLIDFVNDEVIPKIQEKLHVCAVQDVDLLLPPPSCHNDKLISVDQFAIFVLLVCHGWLLAKF